MKRVCLLLAAGLMLLGGSAVRAGEPVTFTGTLNLAPVSAEPAGPCCTAPAGGAQCRHPRSCLDWLMYKPPRCHNCCCVVSTCWPPLYTWFLDMCPSCGRGGCGHGCAAPAVPCADGGCGKPVLPPVDAPHQP